MTRSLTEVSRDLRALAPGSAQGERAIRELADKLRDGGQADLVGVDLAGAYPPEVMLPDAGTWWRRVVTGLELGRDILIFVPVIYTWWKISVALKAYGSYTGSDPFLLAWQKGFGSGTERLSESAIVIAAVVLGVIGLTVVAHLLRDAYEQRVRRRQQRLSALLAEVTLLATQSLTAGQTDATKAELAQIGGQITDSARALREALADAGKSIIDAVNTNPGSKLHEMFQQWVAAANELATLGNRLQGTQEVVTQLRDTQTALSGLAERIGAESQRMLEAFREERTVTLQATHAHNELATEIHEATTALGEALTGLSERAEQFNGMVHRLDLIVRDLDGDGVRARGGFA